MTKTRRIPSQPRSRKKYEQVIISAKELIGKNGNDSVSMREISKHSGVALASIYQYFPDKNAILQSIMEEFFGQVRVTLTSFLEGSKEFDDLVENLCNMVDVYYDSIKENTVIATLWASLQANPKLIEVDSGDSKFNTDLISTKISNILDTPKEEFESPTLLLTHMLGSTMRFALSSNKNEGIKLIHEYKILLRMRLNSLIL